MALGQSVNHRFPAYWADLSGRPRALAAEIAEPDPPNRDAGSSEPEMPEDLMVPGCE